MKQAPPPQRGMTPQQYFMSLYQQGFTPSDAYSAVQQNFGPPKSPQQQAQDQAKQQQNAQLAQTGGMVAGLVGSKLVYDWASGLWKNTNTGEVVPKETVTQAFNAQGIPYSQSGTLTITRPIPPVQVDGSQAGVLDLSGKTTVVDTPAGPQEMPVEAANDSEFLKSVDWGAAAQAGLGAAQVYGAYKAYKSGDKAGAGIYGTAGAANMYAGGAQLAAGEGASYAGSEALSTIIPGLNILAGAYGGYKTAQAIGDSAAGSQRTKSAVVGGATSGAAIGAGVGSLIPVVGTGVGAAVGAVVGGLAGAVGSWTGSHKGKAQFMRDNIRGVLQENQILDKDYKGTLADGSMYDFGQDGSHLKWKNIDKIAEAQPKAWNAAVPMADAMAASYGFVGQKASDIAAWYAKGAVSNAGDDPSIAIANMQHFAKQQGITVDLVKSKLDEALQDNRINQSQYDYYMSGATSLLGTTQQSPEAQKQQAIAIRPPEGEALRVSPGLYRIDTGELLKAKNLRDALDQAYNQTKKNQQQSTDL